MPASDQTFRLPDGRIFYANPSSGTWDVRDAGPEDDAAPGVPWGVASTVSAMNAGHSALPGDQARLPAAIRTPTPNQYDALPRAGGNEWESLDRAPRPATPDPMGAYVSRALERSDANKTAPQESPFGGGEFRGAGVGGG